MRGGPAVRLAREAPPARVLGGSLTHGIGVIGPNKVRGERGCARTTRRASVVFGARCAQCSGRPARPSPITAARRMMGSGQGERGVSPTVCATQCDVMCCNARLLAAAPRGWRGGNLARGRQAACAHGSGTHRPGFGRRLPVRGALCGRLINCGARLQTIFAHTAASARGHVVALVATDDRWPCRAGRAYCWPPWPG